MAVRIPPVKFEDASPRQREALEKVKAALGKAHGLTSDQILRIRDGQGETARDAAILALARRVAKSGGLGSAAEIAQAREAGLGDPEIPLEIVDRVSAVGALTFAINVTLDGCYDHREMTADDALLRYYTRLMDGVGGMLWGRVTYEMMESAWPAVARDPKAGPAFRAWARKLDAKPKYVVSTTRRDFPWSNTVRVEGDLRESIAALKRRTPRGLLVGSPALAAALEKLGLVDEYRLAVHPVLAGHGPTLFSGLSPSFRMKLLETKRFPSGVIALRYRSTLSSRARDRRRSQ